MALRLRRLAGAETVLPSREDHHHGVFLLSLLRNRVGLTESMVNTFAQ